MALKILVVDKDPTASMALIGSLGAGEVEVSFIDQVDAAVSGIRKNKYSLIILGDKLSDDRNTLDVAEQLKQSNNNKHLPVICIEYHKGRQAKLVGMLKPYGYALNTSDEAAVKLCADRVRAHLNK